MSRRPIAIVGAGAIGGVLGHAFALAGEDVTLVDVDEAHVAAIREGGLTLTGADGSSTVPVDTIHTSHLEMIAPLEIVLLSVKAMHTEVAMAAIAPLLATDGFVVSVQNGLQERTIAEYIGDDRTVGAFVNIYADRAEPGVVAYGGPGTLVIGEVDGSNSKRVNDLVDRLQVWGPARATNNVNGYLWSKLAYGAILIATATTNETISDVLADCRVRPGLIALAGDVLSVAALSGIKPQPFDGWDPGLLSGPLSDDAEANKMFDRLVTRLRNYTKTRTGVWRDLAVHKRRTEVPHHYASVIATAEELGVKVPHIQWLVDTILAIEGGVVDQGAENLDALVKVSKT